VQFKKLTKEQKEQKRWREKRNRLVAKLLRDNPKMLSYEALAEANRRLRRK
jgi:hypothetical protein